MSGEIMKDIIGQAEERQDFNLLSSLKFFYWYLYSIRATQYKLDQPEETPITAMYKDGKFGPYSDVDDTLGVLFPSLGEIREGFKQESRENIISHGEKLDEIISRFGDEKIVDALVSEREFIEGAQNESEIAAYLSIMMRSVEKYTRVWDRAATLEKYKEYIT